MNWRLLVIDTTITVISTLAIITALTIVPIIAATTILFNFFSRITGKACGASQLSLTYAR